MLKIEEKSNILTIREIETLKLIIKGYTTKEIAIVLNIAPTTVKTYRKKLLNKLNVKNCAQLVYEAFKNNLI